MSKPKTWDGHDGCVDCYHERKWEDEEPCVHCYGTDHKRNDLDMYATAEPTIKDSGERREFESGAVRDMQTGKGRCDLMPLGIVARAIKGEQAFADGVIYNIYGFQKAGNIDYLFSAILTFCKHRDWTPAHAMLELSKHFEQGAVKYGERNWEKGLPESCYIDSAVRHYLKWLDGMTDEPHDRAVLWNLICLWWTHENVTESEE